MALPPAGTATELVAAPAEVTKAKSLDDPAPIMVPAVVPEFETVIAQAPFAARLPVYEWRSPLAGSAPATPTHWTELVTIEYVAGLAVAPPVTVTVVVTTEVVVIMTEVTWVIVTKLVEVTVIRLVEVTVLVFWTP